MKKPENIDWEVRKWELVMRLAAAREGASYGRSPKEMAVHFIETADAIINTYKNSI